MTTHDLHAGPYIRVSFEVDVQKLGPRDIHVSPSHHAANILFAAIGTAGIPIEGITAMPVRPAGRNWRFDPSTGELIPVPNFELRSPERPRWPRRGPDRKPTSPPQENEQ